MIVLCIADDPLLLGDDEEKLHELKYNRAIKLAGNDYGKAAYFVGIEILQGQDYISAAHRK